MGELQFLKGLENNLPSLNKRNPEYFYVTTDSGKLILGENVWQSNISLDSVILESARTDTNYVLYMNGKEIFSVPIIIWDVETDLIGCSLSSNNKSYSKLTEVEHGSSFSANVIPYSDNHTFKECKILVGGIDKTSECFDEINMVITINKIRWIPVSNDLDPSKIFELYGYKGIVEHLRKAEKINEIFLT